jgi:hypothetical protein
MKNRKSHESVYRGTAGDAPGEKFDTDIASNLQLAYIEERWEILAAVAWKEYLKQDQGALLMQPAGDGEWDLVYGPAGMFQSDPVMKKYARMIKDYDPKTQIVAIFLTPPDGVNAYLGSLPRERLSPPDAYRKFAALLVDN